MPLILELQTESGVVLGQLDCGWALSFILQSSDLDDTACLRFIDLYGDTTFSGIQAPVLIQEIESAAAVVSDVSITKQHKAFPIVAMARRCESELHTYLKFIGD